MEYTKPNLATGYARDAGMSLHPNLWQNLIAYFSPSMGKTGNLFFDWTRTFAPAPFPTAGSLVTWKDDGPDGGPCVEFGFYNSGYNVNNKGLLFNTLNSGQTAYPPNFIGNGSFVNGYTFSWWFKTGDTSQNMQFFLYGQQNNFQDSANYLYYFYRPGNNDCNITGWTGQNGTALASSNICNNKWHQMTFAVGKSTTWLYLDGRLIASQATNNYSLTLPAWMAIGAPGNVGNNIWKMGDFGIWNRVLDPSEVRQLYTGASPLQPLAIPSQGLLPTNDTETPSVLTALLSMPAPSILYDYLNSVGVQQLTATLLAPTIRVDCIVTPSVLGLTGTLVSPAEVVDCTLTPGVLQLTSSLQNPTENYDWTVTSSVLNLTATEIYPEDIGVIEVINPNVLVGTVSLIDPTINYDFTVIPSTLQLTASFVAPTERIDCIVSPATLQLSANLQTPIVRADVTVTPSVLSLTVSLIDPTVLFSGSVSPSTLVLNANLQTPTELGTYTASFASKIISYNPLVVITNTDPLKVVSIDITDPTDPVLDFATFPSLSYGKDAVYNSVFDCIYIACAEGKILQLDASDFSTYSIIDTEDTNNLEILQSLDTFNKIYVGTDDATGEVLYIDQAVLSSLAMDIQVLQRITVKMDIDIRAIQGGILRSDIQCLQTNKGPLGLDIRVLTDSFDEIAANPIKQTDFHVYINGSEMADVDLASIRIYHAIGEKSTATFNLHRRHDELNATVSGSSSQITNQNTVDIYIQSTLEFSGKAARIRTDSENERVEVTAIGTEKANERRTINVPLASVNEKLHPYHCLVDNEDIYNPYIDPADPNPEFYKGIQVDLGKKTTQNISRYQLFADVASVADSVISGSFQPKQNWTYFWFATARNFLTGITQGSSRYCGTSPASLTSDIWDITGMSYWYQRQFDDLEIEQGSFQVGNAPFKETSTRNGKRISKDKWVDQADGLYRQKDEGYDYTQYAKDVASLEYRKLLNISGAILPKTSCDIDLMIDGYYFYGLRLLTRINIDNTTTAGIYNNNNGFPVAVKTIQIDSGSMRVSMKCDNELSDVELQEIDALRPDEDDPKYKFPAESALVASKFDYGRFETVE